MGSDYSRRKFMRDLGILSTASIAGCLGDTNNNEDHQNLDCELDRLNESESSTYDLDGNEYTVETVVVGDGRAGLRVNDRKPKIYQDGDYLNISEPEVKVNVPENFDENSSSRSVLLEFGECE